MQTGQSVSALVEVAPRNAAPASGSGGHTFPLRASSGRTFPPQRVQWVHFPPVFEVFCGSLGDHRHAIGDIALEWAVEYELLGRNPAKGGRRRLRPAEPS